MSSYVTEAYWSICVILRCFREAGLCAWIELEFGRHVCDFFVTDGGT